MHGIILGVLEICASSVSLCHTICVIYQVAFFKIHALSVKASGFLSKKTH